MEFILDTLGKVGFEWQMGLFNLINFLIVFYILKRFAFGPIQKVLKEREEKTKEAVENFTKAKTSLSSAEQKAQEIIDQAKVEANKVIEKSHDDAKVVTTRMKEKAKSDIEFLIAQAKKNIEIDRTAMRESLREETIQLISLAVERIISEKLDTKKEEAYINDILSSVKK